MNVVEIDASKGKSMVAALYGCGRVVAEEVSSFRGLLGADGLCHHCLG